jgi:hypothetical protein
MVILQTGDFLFGIQGQVQDRKRQSGTACVSGTMECTLVKCIRELIFYHIILERSGTSGDRILHEIMVIAPVFPGPLGVPLRPIAEVSVQPYPSVIREERIDLLQPVTSRIAVTQPCPDNRIGGNGQSTNRCFVEGYWNRGVRQWYRRLGTVFLHIRRGCGTATCCQEEKNEENRTGSRYVHTTPEYHIG